MSDRKYVSLSELADKYGVSARTIRRTVDQAVAAGKISVYRPGPRTVRYNGDEFDRYIKWRGAS